MILNLSNYPILKVFLSLYIHSIILSNTFNIRIQYNSSNTWMVFANWILPSKQFSNALLYEGLLRVSISLTSSFSTKIDRRNLGTKNDNMIKILKILIKGFGFRMYAHILSSLNTFPQITLSINWILSHPLNVKLDDTYFHLIHSVWRTTLFPNINFRNFPVWFPQLCFEVLFEHVLNPDASLNRKTLSQSPV